MVQAYKKGPDFIDTGWHSVATARQSRNLDSFFMSPDQICQVVATSSQDARLSIIEGAMGLYDGLDIHGSSSSAEIAKITRTPIVLVLDVTRMTRTAAAVILGCQLFDPAVRVAGVILNRVRSARQESLLREAVARYCGIPVIGALPVNDRLIIPSRHLGLLSSTEANECEQILESLADIVAAAVDLEALLDLADGVVDLPVTARPPAATPPSASSLALGARPRVSTQRVRIAVVRDEAFCFYYPENLQALEAQGGELLTVDSLRDARLPSDLDALYIGGGFPESYASRLEANASFRGSLRGHAEAGLPICAECGGLVYLGRSLTWQQRCYAMAGALPLDTHMREHRQAHGYTLLRATEQHPWLKAGTVVKGHEFHHSEVSWRDPSLAFAYHNIRGTGVQDDRDGIVFRGIVASYTHVNALASPAWAEAFVAQARAYRAARDCSAAEAGERLTALARKSGRDGSCLPTR
jgi:cobyrinic acid a,c-diamide synthase